MKILTNSRAKAARRCLRYHRIRYELGYRRREDNAEEIRFGDAMHKMLETWLCWIMASHPDEQPTPDDQALEVAIAELPEGGDPYERARLEAVMTGYHFRYREQAWQVLAVEAEYRTPLLNPATGAASRTWLRGGKVDGVVMAGGRRLMVEHKTSSEDISPGSDYWVRTRMDGQLSGYYDGCEALGLPVDGVVYDVIARPRLRPLKAVAEVKMTQGKRCAQCADGFVGLLHCTACAGSGWKERPRPYAGQRLEDETVDEYRARLAADIAANPDAYYQRAEVVRLEAELVDHRYDVWQLTRIVSESERLGRAPRNPDSCFAHRRPCSFLAVCNGEASLDDDRLFERLENVHPELAEGEPPSHKEIAA